MELPSVEEMELPILSVYARAVKQGRDRRGEALAEVDHGSGLPVSANDLVPHAAAITGTKLAMQIRVEPEVWATAFMALTHKPPKDWTAEEAWARNELEQRIKRCVHKMAEQGYFQERYASEWDGAPMAVGLDGLCIRAAITASGLDYAVSRCRGTKYETGAVSILSGAPTEVINAAPEHAKALWREENKAK